MLSATGLRTNCSVVCSCSTVEIQAPRCVTTCGSRFVLCLPLDVSLMTPDQQRLRPPAMGVSRFSAIYHTDLSFLRPEHTRRCCTSPRHKDSSSIRPIIRCPHRESLGLAGRSSTPYLQERLRQATTRNDAPTSLRAHGHWNKSLSSQGSWLEPWRYKAGEYVAMDGLNTVLYLFMEQR